MSLLPFEAAQALLLEAVGTLARSQTLALTQAFGRVLSRSVEALRTHPPFDASAMDGYALRHEDASVGAILEVIGQSAAGAAFDGIVRRGQAVRIFTGAPLPQGADTVLIQEDATLIDGRQVRVDAMPGPRRHIRSKGTDFKAGDTLLAAGQELTAGALALAASGGHPMVEVVDKPRVAVLATGDELVLPGADVGPSQIIASNHFGLMALIEANGGDPVDLGIAPDDLDAIAGRVRQATADGADIVVTIGGASVGDRDLVAPALQALGIRLDFWKVAMRPGKPLMAGRLDDRHIIGLPGNPASTMVAATLFLRPLIRRLAGLPDGTQMRSGRLGADVAAGGERAEFMRATCRQDATGAVITALPRQDSSLLSIYAAADVLLFRPVKAPAAQAGEACLYIPLD